MADITFTIPNEKVPIIVDAMKGLYPIPVDENGDPEFTDNAWAKECIRRFIKRTVARYTQKSAIDAISYQEDDDIAS